MPCFTSARFSHAHNTAGFSVCRQPMLPRQRKDRMPVDRTNRIVDTLYVAESVVVEVRLRDLGRPQMHKHRTHPAIRKLLLQVRHVADGLAAEGAAEVTQEDQQYRRSLASTSKFAPDSV